MATSELANEYRKDTSCKKLVNSITVKCICQMQGGSYKGCRQSGREVLLMLPIFARFFAFFFYFCCLANCYTVFFFAVSLTLFFSSFFFAHYLVLLLFCAAAPFRVPWPKLTLKISFHSKYTHKTSSYCIMGERNRRKKERKAYLLKTVIYKTLPHAHPLLQSLKAFGTILYHLHLLSPLSTKESFNSSLPPPCTYMPTATHNSSRRANKLFNENSHESSSSYTSE